MALQHIVAFRFTEPLSDQERIEIREHISSWPEKIGTMSKLRFGSDITQRRNAGYDYLLLMEFESMKAMEEYRAHPVHREFESWLSGRSCEPMAFDYELDADTIFVAE